MGASRVRITQAHGVAAIDPLECAKRRYTMGRGSRLRALSRTSPTTPMICRGSLPKMIWLLSGSPFGQNCFASV